ncbi:nitrous oxide reductase accessory protein NosL [Bacillus aquiflavi]|uniref:Nitrous oxide reductase accessory protein NosL n=1 Tax=Bacillus aquiflavi TaxID=2672567 RepID=A0A6B3VZT4_9BACI|nr:nitrous oxide reductase accessory protein NosL [Bacillus aquiflavi]MBA4536729.1 nitrous oxide reductase accessory protein NosL [Bacillus aquiflavi]NEY81096.1 nitrous oxide reduction protein [Bacillus aquiflavi]UAC48760.1 nitrous oxide reductase accessory protein NosL [Bacillus aquiflavi]
MKAKFFVIVIVILLLTACGKDQAYEPEDINPEVDVCEVCNMSIASEMYATQLMMKDGEVYKFDDIGCMIEFIEKDQKDGDLAKKYVRDVETGEWVELDKAYHVYDPDIWTPMANGVISFETKERAEDYIKKEGMGELYNYEKLQKHKWGWE